MATKMQIQASKGPNEQLVVFADLKPWLVHVKVETIHSIRRDHGIRLG